jgi:thiamine biosynthesis protein ThiS
MFMEILLNNRKESFSGRSEMTVRELLQEKKFTFKFLVVRRNDQVVREDDYDGTLISDGDKVVVLHLMAGG